MNIVFTPESLAEYMDWMNEDRKTLKRINQILKDITRSPYEGIGKPEALRGDLSGFWSRRIDDKHRIVYEIANGQCCIIQCKGHYGDT